MGADGWVQAILLQSGMTACSIKYTACAAVDEKNIYYVYVEHHLHHVMLSRGLVGDERFQC